MTEKQLKNGEVAKLLQDNRTHKCYLAQKLGEMPSLYNEKYEPYNYVWYNINRNRWTCNIFDITNYVPVGLDFYADTVIITRNFQKEKIYTLCLPFDWTADVSNVYTQSSVNESEGIASFREVTYNEDAVLGISRLTILILSSLRNTVITMHGMMYLSRLSPTHLLPRT